MFKIKNFFRKKPKNVNPYGWFGNYNTWDEAKSSASGYEAGNILEKTKQSLLKIKNGEATYERDSVLFDKKEYLYAIISSLLYIAVKNGNKLNVIDFGGSLGSTWFQVRDFIPVEIEISWSIVEQTAYVEEGKKHFVDDVLDFYFNIDDCTMAKKNVNVVLLSSVLQYLEKPHEFLDRLTNYKIDYLLFDRTAFINGPSLDRLTIQIVPPEIYDARYPSWFFNEDKFLNHFNDYQLKADFFPYIGSERSIAIDHQFIGYDKGFLFEKKR
ncbi:hypothetical protein D3C86_532110 [compost metagenome]